MIINKALYGLRRSGAAYHAFFADTMRSLGFVPCIADQDVWMRDALTLAASRPFNRYGRAAQQETETHGLQWYEHVNY